MAGEGAETDRQADGSHAHAAGKEYGTLVLDGFGRIRSCGAAAARMLGCGIGDVAGRPIANFVAGLALSGSSASYSTRFIAHLCADGGWRRFDAVDACGRGFAVDLALSRVTSDGQDYFLLSLRRIEEGHR